MAYSLPAYTFELDFNVLLTGAGTPSTDASSPISSYPSSPVASPSTTQSGEPHIPRPLNSYMIFQSEYVTLHKESLPDKRQKSTKLAAAAWRKLSKESKDYYKELAKQRKEEHARAHPGYKYQPRRSQRGKKSGGRKKTDAPVAQISMDTQTFYRPPMPNMPEVLQLQPGPVLPSVEFSHQYFMTSENGNGNESFIGFATTQATRPVQILNHPPSPASFSPIQLDIPQIEEPGAFSIHNMDENDELGRLLTRRYSLDFSYLDMIYDQAGGSLYNEWGSGSDLDSPAAVNYSPFLASPMANDAMEPVFLNSFGPY